MEQAVRFTDSVTSCRGAKQGPVFSTYTAHWEAPALGTAGCEEELKDFMGSSWHTVSNTSYLAPRYRAGCRIELLSK